MRKVGLILQRHYWDQDPKDGELKECLEFAKSREEWLVRVATRAALRPSAAPRCRHHGMNRLEIETERLILRPAGGGRRDLSAESGVSQRRMTKTSNRRLTTVLARAKNTNGRGQRPP